LLLPYRCCRRRVVHAHYVLHDAPAAAAPASPSSCLRARPPPALSTRAQ